jgi:hypothetical protein
MDRQRYPARDEQNMITQHCDYLARQATIAVGTANHAATATNEQLRFATEALRTIELADQHTLPLQVSRARLDKNTTVAIEKLVTLADMLSNSSSTLGGIRRGLNGELQAHSSLTDHHTSKMSSQLESSTYSLERVKGAHEQTSRHTSNTAGLMSSHIRPSLGCIKEDIVRLRGRGDPSDSFNIEEAGSTADAASEDFDIAVTNLQRILIDQFNTGTSIAGIQKALPELSAVVGQQGINFKSSKEARDAVLDGLSEAQLATRVLARAVKRIATILQEYQQRYASEEEPIAEKLAAVRANLKALVTANTTSIETDFPALSAALQRITQKAKVIPRIINSV